MLSVSGSCLNNPLTTDLKLIANSGLSNHRNRPKLTLTNQKGGSYYKTEVIFTATGYIITETHRQTDRQTDR